MGTPEQPRGISQVTYGHVTLREGQTAISFAARPNGLAYIGIGGEEPWAPERAPVASIVIDEPQLRRLRVCIDEMLRAMEGGFGQP